MKKTVLALSLLMTTAYAGSPDVVHNVVKKPWILSFGTQTENNKMSVVPIGHWQLAQNASVTYQFTDNFYASAAIDMVGQNSYGYKLTAGAQIPVGNFLGYGELTYNHPAFTAQNIDYDLGVVMTMPFDQKLALRVELDDPIKTQESFKLGALYKVTKDLTIETDYSMRFDNRANSLGLKMSYAI